MIKKMAVILLIPVVMFLFNCGKKGPLVLEPELTPTAIENFQIFQVGDTIKLQWSFPQTLAGKKKTNFEVEKIEKIYIYYSTKEITGGKFKKKSTLLKKLTLQDLNRAPISLATSSRVSRGSKASPSSTSSTSSPSSTSYGTTEIKNLSYFITIPFKIKELDNKNHFFGILYYYQKKRAPISQVAFVHSLVPVKPVADLKLNQEKKVIKLTWSKPTQDESGNSIANITGYNIYRKVEPEKTAESETTAEPPEAGTPTFMKINQDNVLMEYYEDTDTGINGNYSYYVSAVVSNQIESAPSQEVSVRITDIFPPEVPANLVCFRAPDHLFLNWKPVTDSDFAYYKLYRRSGTDTEFKLAADNITTTSYKDKNLQKGKTYFYTVTAVDQKGNESEYSNEVKEQF